MAQLEPFQPEIEKLGGSLLYVAAEKAGGMFKPSKFLQEHPISYAFLLDEDREITKKYGVYHRLGLDAVNIARTATFVLGRDGIIRYIYVGDNQTDRAPVEDVMSELRKALAQ